MNIKKITTLTSGALAALMLVPVIASAATNVIVTPTDTKGWASANVAAGGTATFVTDTTSPLPTGALELTTTDSTASKITYKHSTATPLADVTELSYATKNVSGPTIAAPAYQLEVCLNGATETSCSGYTTLVYEPYQNGTVVPGEWQNWDVDAGLFWSTRTVAPLVGTAGGPATYTLAAIKTAFPNAVVVSYAANVGSNNPSYVVRTDAFNFNGTIYNFEVTAKPVSATNKDDCKEGGWKEFQTDYKNQGDCVSAVASKDKAQGNPVANFFRELL